MISIKKNPTFLELLNRVNWEGFWWPTWGTPVRWCVGSRAIILDPFGFQTITNQEDPMSNVVLKGMEVLWICRWGGWMEILKKNGLKNLLKVVFPDLSWNALMDCDWYSILMYQRILCRACGVFSRPVLLPLVAAACFGALQCLVPLGTCSWRTDGMWNGLALQVCRVLEGLYYQFVNPLKETLMSMLSLRNRPSRSLQDMAAQAVLYRAWCTEVVGFKQWLLRKADGVGDCVGCTGALVSAMPEITTCGLNTNEAN